MAEMAEMRAATMPVGRSFGQTARETARLVKADAGFYLAIAAYMAAGLALLAATGTADRATYGVYVMRWTIAFAFLFPAIGLLVRYGTVIHRFDRRRRLALRRAFSVRRNAHFAAGIALSMALVLFQGTFTSIKNAMPVWRGGFAYDRLQADIDRWLHFGVDPWRWLQPLGDSHLVRIAVEWNYNTLWFALCFGALFFVAASPAARAIRSRYLACFMLVWVVCGNLLAVAFLSAGPAFYGAVTGDEARFAEQLAFLAAGAGEVNSAAFYQHYLWTLHMAGKPGFGSGISAFPSVHVALVAMNAFFIAEHSRRLGLLAFAYLGFILASSVYLAWHYAIDGYASILVVAVIHMAARRVFARPQESLTAS